MRMAQSIESTAVRYHPGFRIALGCPPWRRQARLTAVFGTTLKFSQMQQFHNSGSYQGCYRRSEQAGRALPILACKNRGPTQVKSEPLRGSHLLKTNSLHTATDAGRKVLCEVGSPASGWASSRRCLTGYPRGASKARDDRYEVNLPVVPAGTPSARAEALSWLIRLAPCWLSATRTRCRCARWHAG